MEKETFYKKQVEKIDKELALFIHKVTKENLGESIVELGNIIAKDLSGKKIKKIEELLL